jgi:hypothetical protein
LTDAPAEPTNLVLEQLRLIRAEALATGVEKYARFDRLDSDVAEIKKDILWFKLNTIAEVYKTNLTLVSLLDHEERI